MRTESGLRRSCRFQPTVRSPEIRAPEARTAFIVPNDASPTMKYIGAEIPEWFRLWTCWFGPAIA